MATKVVVVNSSNAQEKFLSMKTILGVLPQNVEQLNRLFNEPRLVVEGWHFYYQPKPGGPVFLTSSALSGLKAALKGKGVPFEEFSNSQVWGLLKETTPAETKNPRRRKRVYKEDEMDDTPPPSKLPKVIDQHLSWKPFEALKV